MIEKAYYQVFLQTGQKVSGNVSKKYPDTQLSAKFQIKCREYGVTDEESLAAWIVENKDRCELYFPGKDVQVIADRAFAKIRGANFENLD